MAVGQGILIGAVVVSRLQTGGAGRDGEGSGDMLGIGQRERRFCADALFLEHTVVAFEFCC